MNDNSKEVFGFQNNPHHEINAEAKQAATEQVVQTVGPTQPAQHRITEEDLLKWELAKLNKQLAISQAETALAKSDLADLHHRYTVMQIYMKYKLTDQDTINNGVIVYGGANKS